MGAGRFATSASALFMILALAAALAPACAQVNASTINKSVSLTFDTNTGSLLPGADNPSTFHMNFLLDDTRRMTETPLGTTRDLGVCPGNRILLDGNAVT